jgi:la-related protein 6
MAAENNTAEVPDIHIEPELEQRVDSKCESLSSGNGSDSDGEKSDLESKARLILPRPPKQQESYDSVSSNGEDDEGFELTEDLREKIVIQAEYYFSDENLRRDGFLLKHVKRNKEGFVNLKLLASFKKMRSLSRDYRVIGEALKTSTKLIVSENGLKIRRVDTLPKELLDQARVKNLVISKMPHENPSMDYVIAAFPGHNEDVISVRIVKPGKKFPNDLQSHFSRHVELKNQIVAVVEFDSPENAAAAIKSVDRENYQGMDVKLLELGPKQAKRMSNSESATSDTQNESDTGTGRRAKKKTGNRLLQVNGKEDSHSSYASSSDSDWSSFSSCSKRYNRSHGNNKSPTPSPSTSPKGKSPIELMNNKGKSPQSSPADSPKTPRRSKKVADSSPIRKLSPLVASESPRSSPEIQRKFVKRETDKSGKLSPWMLQRMQLTKNDSDFPTHKHLEVIRQPKGPDGSFGFSNHPLKKYFSL